MKPGRTKKLSLLWRGPYTVLDRTSPVNYKVQLIGGTATLIVHCNRLKTCYGEPNRGAVTNARSHILPQTPTGQPCATNPSLIPSSPRDALTNAPPPPGGFTSSEIPQGGSPPSSRPVRNRLPPVRYGDYVEH